MLVSQRHKAAFVHIPKCGGSTIRQQFSGISDIEKDFTGPFDHPEMGRVRLGHLPLWALREHYPDAFAALTTCRIHALTRDPFDRFESAVSEYLYHQETKRINEFTADEVLTFARDIIENVSKTEKLTALKYCHFIRQSEFVFLDGAQVVEAVYPLSKINRLIKDLGAATDTDAATGLHSNQTLDFKIKGSEKTLRRLSGMSKQLLPMKLHARAKKWVKSLITQQGSKHKGFSRKNAEISDFITAYYAQDIALFESASLKFKS